MLIDKYADLSQHHSSMLYNNPVSNVLCVNPFHDTEWLPRPGIMNLAVKLAAPLNKTAADTFICW